MSTDQEAQTKPGVTLSQEELNEIKNQLLESIYADIGKNVVKKIMWIGGSIICALYALITHSDIIKTLAK